MATTYKTINSSVPAILTAQAFADGIDIYGELDANGRGIEPFHRLRECTRFQWRYDDLLGNIVDATGVSNLRSYTVNTSSVANSGEYFCEIQIGTTGDCNQTTPRRRVSIIDCGPAPGLLDAVGGSGTAVVIAPHYETAVFNAEGNAWVLPQGGITTTTAANVSTFTQSFNLQDIPESFNQSRRGQPTITVGDYVCYYNIVQNYRRAAIIDGFVPVAPAGPVLTLSQDGPTTINGRINVVAALSVGGTDIDLDLAASPDITWSIVGTAIEPLATDTLGPSTGRLLILRPGGIIRPFLAGVSTITATATLNNIPVSASIDVEFTQAAPTAQTAFSGGLTSIFAQCFDPLNFTGSSIAVPGNSTSFSVSGGGSFTFNVNASLYGFFGNRGNPLVGERRGTATISGPAFPTPRVVVITLTDANPTFRDSSVVVEGTPGSYRIDIAWDSCPARRQDAGAGASISAFVSANNFFDFSLI